MQAGGHGFESRWLHSRKAWESTGFGSSDLVWSRCLPPRWKRPGSLRKRNVPSLSLIARFRPWRPGWFGSSKEGFSEASSFRTVNQTPGRSGGRMPPDVPGTAPATTGKDEAVAIRSRARPPSRTRPSAACRFKSAALVLLRFERLRERERTAASGRFQQYGVRSTRGSPTAARSLACQSATVC